MKKLNVQPLSISRRPILDVPAECYVQAEPGDAGSFEYRIPGLQGVVMMIERMGMEHDLDAIVQRFNQVQDQVEAVTWRCTYTRDIGVGFRPREENESAATG